MASVDVVMGTYNHARFVGRAIESALAQECDHDVRLRIADDCSTDGTQEVLRDYQARHPDRITLALDTENRGILSRDRLFSRLLRESTADYIALLDTDDYWADPHKLQKQVGFLESHPDYVVCYHDARIIDEEGRPVQDSKLPVELKRDFSADELVRGPMLLTVTMCFRNVLGEYPEEFYNVYNADNFLTSLLGNFGKGKYMGEIAPAVYRRHAAAVWSSLGKSKQIFQNGNTRAWLHRYYRRTGKQEYARYFRDEVTRWFSMALSSIAAEGRPDDPLVKTMLTGYTDILDERNLRQLEAVLQGAKSAQRHGAATAGDPEGDVSLRRVLWLYEGGNVGMAENVLAEYCRRLGEGAA